MSPRRTVASAAAVVGAACFLALAIVPAGAAIERVPIYASTVSGEGVLLAAAVRPSILESAAQFGSHFAEITYSSQGGGATQSIAAPLFPGKAAMGALTANVGCGGVKGWVEARYPASVTPPCRTEQSDGVLAPEQSSIGRALGVPEFDDLVNDTFARATPGIGAMRVTAGLAQGSSHIVTNGLTLRTEPGGPPLLTIGSLELDVRGMRPVEGILSNTVRVMAKNIELMGGGIKIASLESIASTSSDGEQATADAALTFGRVTVMMNGTEREAVIDHDGIRVTDPAFTREEAIGATETVEDHLLRAGVTITAASPVEITEGPRADASVAGLVLSFRATLPPVVFPDQVAPVWGLIIDEIKPQCLTDFGLPVPLCFGAGVVPLSGSEPVASLTIGRAGSFSVGARPAIIITDPPIDPTDPFTPVGPVSPPVPVDPFTPVGPPPTTGEQPAVPIAQPEGPLVGLVARLQDEWLAFAGALATILAFSLAAWPSLRDGRTR